MVSFLKINQSINSIIIIIISNNKIDWNSPFFYTKFKCVVFSTIMQNFKQEYPKKTTKYFSFLVDFIFVSHKRCGVIQAKCSILLFLVWLVIYCCYLWLNSLYFFMLYLFSICLPFSIHCLNYYSGKPFIFPSSLFCKWKQQANSITK